MRTSFYYDRGTKTEIPTPGYDPLNPDHVELLPENIFWTGIPADHELTFDLNGIPNGSQPIPIQPEELVRADLRAADITSGRLTAELFKDSQALPNDLASIYSDIQTIATNHSLTAAGVVDVLR